jgi:hypothetical protein
MKHILLAGLILTSCSTAQLTKAEQDANTAMNAVTTACAIAEGAESQVQGIAAVADQVSNIGAYVNGACGTADAIIKVAQNPTTVTWLNQIAADLTSLSKNS